MRIQIYTNISTHKIEILRSLVCVDHFLSISYFLWGVTSVSYMTDLGYKMSIISLSIHPFPNFMCIKQS